MHYYVLDVLCIIMYYYYLLLVSEVITSPSGHIMRQKTTDSAVEESPETRQRLIEDSLENGQRPSEDSVEDHVVENGHSKMDLKDNKQGTVICHCAKRHSKNCGCLTESLLRGACTNFFYCLIQAETDPSAFASRLLDLGRYHARDIHIWPEGQCNFHALINCTCAKITGLFVQQVISAYHSTSSGEHPCFLFLLL